MKMCPLEDALYCNPVPLVIDTDKVLKKGYVQHVQNSLKRYEFKNICFLKYYIETKAKSLIR